MGLCGTNNKAFHSRIYVDNRLHHMMALNIGESFWDRGAFPEVVNNGSQYIALTNPWVNGTKAAPFDKRTFFFLATLDGRKLMQLLDSLLSDRQRRRRWNERVVPGWLRK